MPQTNRQKNHQARVDAYNKEVMAIFAREGCDKITPEIKRELRLLHMKTFPEEYNGYFAENKKKEKKKNKKEKK